MTSIAQIGSHATRALYPGMVKRHGFAFAGDLFQRDGLSAFAPGGDHHTILTLVDEFGAGGAQARGQETIHGRGRAAALDIAQYGNAGLEVGEVFKLMGQSQRIAGVQKLQRGNGGPGFFLFRFPFRCLFFSPGFLVDGGVLFGSSAFRHGHDAETFSTARALTDGAGNTFHVVGDFRYQNDIGPARDAGAQRQPTRPVSHDFHDDDPMMAVSSAVEAIDGFGGNSQGGIETEGDIGQRHIVINGFGKGDDVETLLFKFQSCFLRAAAAEADQGIKMIFFIVFDDGVGGIEDFSAHGHAVRTVPAGSQNGTANGENAGEAGFIEGQSPVFHDAPKAIAKANDLHAKISVSRLADAANRGVQAGTVPTRGQNADIFCHEPIIPGKFAPAPLQYLSRPSRVPVKRRTHLVERDIENYKLYCGKVNSTSEKRFQGEGRLNMSNGLKTGENLAHGIRRIEKRQIGRIMERLGESHPDRQGKAVHEARKDLKKARAALRLIREKLDAKDYQKENRNLRKVGQALARRRDAEVLLKTVDKLHAGCHDGQTGEILARLRRVLLERNEEFFHRPPMAPKVKAKLKSARGQIKRWHLGGLKWSDLSCGNQRTYKEGRKALHEAEQTRAPENLHEWRKRVKDMWYQLRVLQPAQPKAIKRRAREMKQLSEYLGDDHDLTMFKEAVKTAKFSKTQRKLLDELADSQREKLEQAAFELGRRLYAEKPATFGRRIKHYGKKWGCC